MPADDEPSLTDRFPDLQPGKKPGGLGGVNGFGTTLIGRRGVDDETGTYVTTHWATALFVPIWALAAYRVARGEQGGWYVLGRVPLSGFARAVNLLVVLAVLGGAGAIWWNHHTGTPEYVAARKVEQAEAAAAAGQGAKAAEIYKEVMDTNTPSAEAARRGLAALLADPPGPPGEAAGVFAVAADLHRDDRCPVPDLFDKGKAAAARCAATDPAAALAVLEAVAPFAPDPTDEVAVRVKLLEQVHAKSPADPDAASRLAAAYEEGGQRDKAETLLAPLAATLGTRDGAAVLGRIYAARGELDKAHDLLAPFVEKRLPALRAAEAGQAGRFQSAQRAAVDLLKTGKAPGFDYKKYERGSDDEQQQMITEFVVNKLRADPSLKAAGRALVAERAVVGAVLDLGLVQLQRGQKRADPAARAAELQAAEQTFLSVKGAAGDTDAYRLSLGQVYYWLGRPADGKKLFDELLAARGGGTDAALMVAGVLRSVGDNTGSRKLAEDAYGKETDPAKKQRAAGFRARVQKDVDDQIEWLTRSDTAQPDTQATLATARGHKARQDGKDEEAAAQFRKAVELYAGMPEETATLNNSALSLLALYQVTLDPADLTRGLDRLDRAIAREPSDSILLLNAASAALRAVARDAVGTAVDYRPLKTSPGWEAVPYLYQTPAERAALAARLAANPGMVRAKGYAEKLVVLSPKRDESYSLLAQVCEQTRDLAGMAAAADRAAAADPDTADDAKEYREYLSGESDKARAGEVRTEAARAAEAVPAAQAVGGRTFAVAVGRHVQYAVAVWGYGDAADPDALVKLAEEADKVAPSVGAGNTLDAALAFRAHLTLMRDHPEYARLAEKARRSLGRSVLYYALSTSGPLRDQAAADPDVKRLAGRVLDEVGRDLEAAGVSAWLLTRAVHPNRAKEVADKVRANGRAQARKRLEKALAPYRATTALDEYYAKLMDGDEAAARKTLADAAAKGVPVP